MWTDWENDEKRKKHLNSTIFETLGYLTNHLEELENEYVKSLVTRLRKTASQISITIEAKILAKMMDITKYGFRKVFQVMKDIEASKAGQQVIMKPIQAVTLLQFQETDSLDFFKLQELTLIDKDTLAKAVQGLIEVGLLRLNTKGLCESSNISINLQLKTKEKNLNVPSPDFKMEEPKFQGSLNLSTQAAIVRSVKSHHPHPVTYQILLKEVQGRVQKYFTLDEKIFQDALVHLTEREHINFQNDKYSYPRRSKTLNPNSKPWFDRECYLTKRNTKSNLKIYMKSKKETKRVNYISKKKFYAALIRDKKKKYYQSLHVNLSSNTHDSKNLWKTISIYIKKKKFHSRKHIASRMAPILRQTTLI
ncbi:hypothetical protein LAZ67_14001272 [Cordylochernes scorpioides]|uniref:Uncharacterized protein n=1 Tax=Cordylochernes scorpioides TaxID=51811 RepID=A0ABY6L809_9ARAC|nr:hypothetical protein LAZ67_14001264 [Cordylochernes scorpioides]UYV76583.1 hypothetical protein LAZ67_14001272 [Cordylochernes scorpioides]